MLKVVIALFSAIMILAVPAFAGDTPAKYKKCKMCHGMPGAGKGKVGPDLVTSSFNLEQFQRIVKVGSKGLDDRPTPKQAKYAKKKMTAQKGVSADDVKAIYEFVQSAK